MSRLFDGTALHAFFYEFGSIPSAALILLPAAFATSPVRPTRYFSGAVQYCADGTSALTLRDRFCTAMLMEIALRVTKGLVAVFAAKEQVPLLDELIMAALLSLDQSWMQLWRPSPIVGKLLE